MSPTMSDVLNAIRNEPGVRLRGLRSTFGIPLPDQDEARTVAHYIQQLEELGIVHQDHGGWYAVPDTYDSIRAERRVAAHDARAAMKEERAAIRTQALRERASLAHASVAARLEASVAQVSQVAAGRLERVKEFDRLTQGMTLRTIAQVCGKSPSSAQAWREGRCAPPVAAIATLRAFNGEEPGDQTDPQASPAERYPYMPDAEDVTDLI